MTYWTIQADLSPLLRTLTGAGKMEAAKSAQVEEAPAAGAAPEPQHTASTKRTTAANQGEVQGRSASTFSAVYEEECASEEEDPSWCGQDDSAKAKKTPSSEKADASPYNIHQPLPLGSSSSHTFYEAPPATAIGHEALADAAATENARAGSADESDKFTFASQMSCFPVSDLPPRYSATSPSAYSLDFVSGRSIIPKEGLHLARRAATENVSSFHRSHDEKSQPGSPLASGRGRHDVIEFVVRRPNFVGGKVPFLPAGKGLCVPPLHDPHFRQSAFVEKEGIVQAAAEPDDVQHRLYEQEGRHGQLRQATQRDMYMPAQPGSLLFLPHSTWGSLEGSEFVSDGGKQTAPHSIFTGKAVTPVSFSPDMRQLFYPLRPTQTPEIAYFKRGPSVEPQMLRAEAWWSLREKGAPFVADDVAVAVPPRRERWPPLLLSQHTPRSSEKGRRIVLPNAESYLCFGHAGDEKRFCFGLLQLPPPPLKYDFLIESKRVYCGLCESVDYVAVCRKCRMRLPKCPFCHKQSAIRHP